MPHSLSKTPVSPETAAQIVARHLGASLRITAFRELTEGFFNTACELVLSDGMHCVLKVAPPADVTVLRYEKDVLSTEVDVMRLVRERTEVPVPVILVADDSREILPAPFFLMEYLDGMPLNKLRPGLSASDQAAIDRETGRLLQQINSIAGDTFGYPARSEERSSNWAEAFQRMYENVLQDGLDAGVDLPYDRLRDLLGRGLPALDEVSLPHLVHWDLWDGNIFVDRQTVHITGIIDFERALWADPLMECNFGAFGINPHFIDGYDISLPYTPSQVARRKLYNLYLYLIMVIECTYRRYETPEQENWARGQLQREMEE
jgi:aminoglycoside phosphotransferase (APT) family kinase protein